jgi:hypothetical protein
LKNVAESRLFVLYCFESPLFSDCSILEAKPQPGMSYTWYSIIRGVKLVKEEIIWRVCTRDSIDVWRDPWLLGGSTRRPRSPSPYVD